MNHSLESLLEVEDLRLYLDTDEGLSRPVDGVSFSIRRGETLVLVGESGCGKSLTALSLLRLTPAAAPGSGGRILFHPDGDRAPPVDIAQLDPRGEAIRRIRGDDIAMIFQDPMSALSPVHTVGSQVDEVIRLHQGVDRREARRRTIEALRRVALPSPERQANAYPHQLSGGMRQRVLIAMALACGPSLLIADEPTTALDVTVQAEILDLIEALQDETGMALLLITHDFGVAARMADRAAVMYLGKIVEHAEVTALFDSPRHPYTQALLASRPRLGAKRALRPIRGSVPDARDIPRGCAFGPRCSRHAYPGWDDEVPPLVAVAPGHFARCCGTCA